MGQPTHCTNPECRYSVGPRSGWRVRDGWYHSRCGGAIQRYRCRGCRTRLSDQSESIHYFAKRRLDLTHIFLRLRGGSSLRDIARSQHCAPATVSQALLRLGRQAMCAQLLLLCGCPGSHSLVFDALLSRLCSADYPAHLHTLLDAPTELILAITHSITYRSGPRTPAQRRRIAARRAGFSIAPHCTREAVSLLITELSRFICPAQPLLIDTDRHPLYRPLLAGDRALRHFSLISTLGHRRTASTAPRTTVNPLFPVNLVDRLIRHRLKEHTRQSFAFGRNATLQMHRLWLFAYDHNFCQPHRVASGSPLTRAHRYRVPDSAIRAVHRRFFHRRFDIAGLPLPQSMHSVWTARLLTPPVRWRCAQSTSGPPIPHYALRDLNRAHLHAP
jgi:hypothetical protein